MEDLSQQFYQFLAGREGKKDKTLDGMMRTFRRMQRDGFDPSAFARGETAAQEEGDRYLLWLRTAAPLPRGRRTTKTNRGGSPNAVKVLKALARMHRFKDADWKLPRQAPPQPDCYTLDELARQLRLPYGRSEARRLERAAVEAHLALGWRLDELEALEDTDVDATTHTVFLRHPEKGNPQRRLPVEPELFAGSPGHGGARGPFMAWLRERPQHPANPHWVWVYTDKRTGTVRRADLAKTLQTAGRTVGVRLNCTRGRHTRCAALLAQGRQLAFVRFFMGHSGIATLTAYIEMVSLGLLNHLSKTSWFSRPPSKGA